MQQVFWLRPRLIAGRPDPDLQPWRPREFAAAGIGAVISVNDAGSVYADELAEAGLEHAHFALSDSTPPRDGDFERCMRLLARCHDYLSATVDSGKSVLIHCSAGKDRTGLVMCYYLCRRESFSPRAALDELRRFRPIALSAPGYEDFSIVVLSALLRG